MTLDEAARMARAYRTARDAIKSSTPKGDTELTALLIDALARDAYSEEVEQILINRMHNERDTARRGGG